MWEFYLKTEKKGVKPDIRIMQKSHFHQDGVSETM